jgi:RecB family exonuclease
VKKLPVDELLRLACIYAEIDREGYLMAINKSGAAEEKARTEAFLKQLREYRWRRWGKTGLECQLEEMKPVNPLEILRRMREAGEIQ